MSGFFYTNRNKKAVRCSTFETTFPLIKKIIRFSKYIHTLIATVKKNEQKNRMILYSH